ncbi:hypothetical protein HX889_41520 [Pseudomonas reactans]|nr:hypothetical protein [Pseudomonas reactans]
MLNQSVSLNGCARPRTNNENSRKIILFWLTGSADAYRLSDRADVAKKIVRLKQEGKGSNLIAKVLNQEGIAGIRSPQ